MIFNSYILARFYVVRYLSCFYLYAIMVTKYICEKILFPFFIISWIEFPIDEVTWSKLLIFKSYLNSTFALEKNWKKYAKMERAWLQVFGISHPVMLSGRHVNFGNLCKLFELQFFVNPRRTQTLEISWHAMYKWLP